MPSYAAAMCQLCGSYFPTEAYNLIAQFTFPQEGKLFEDLLYISKCNSPATLYIINHVCAVCE